MKPAHESQDASAPTLSIGMTLLSPAHSPVADQVTPAGDLRSSFATGTSSFERPSFFTKNSSLSYSELKAASSPDTPQVDQQLSNSGETTQLTQGISTGPLREFRFFGRGAHKGCAPEAGQVGLSASDGLAVEDDTDRVAKEKAFLVRHKRKLLCCGCCIGVTTAVLVTLILVAYFVFRPKQPTFKMQNIKVVSFNPDIALALPPKVTLDMNLTGELVVYNPNTYDLEYSNSTAHLYYTGQEIGQVPINSGVVGAGDTVVIPTQVAIRRLSVTSKAPAFISDLQKNVIPLKLGTTVEGNLHWFWFGRDFTVTAECTFKVDPNYPRFQTFKVAETSCNVKIEDGHSQS